MTVLGFSPREMVLMVSKTLFCAWASRAEVYVSETVVSIPTSVQEEVTYGFVKYHEVYFWTVSAHESPCNGYTLPLATRQTMVYTMVVCRRSGCARRATMGHWQQRWRRWRGKSK